MYIVVVVATTTETYIALELQWSTSNKHYVQLMIHIYLATGQRQNLNIHNALTHMETKRIERFKNRDPGEKAGEDANVIHIICCPSGIFHPYYLLLSHLHYKFWKNSDIVKGDRNNNEGVLY